MNISKNFFAVLLLLASSISFSKDIDIFKAVNANKYSLVKKYVKENGISNELNSNNKTILDISVERDHKKITRYLVKRGAKVSTQENAWRLESYLNGRALGFFFGGLFFSPWLWIGSLSALSMKSKISIL